MQHDAQWLLRMTMLVVICAFVPAAQSQAQQRPYPSKPIRIIIGYPPGGGTDVTARLLAQKMSDQAAQPVVVENRPGASGLLAIEKVAASSPDGYTLLLMASSSILLTALRPALPFSLERDLTPVSLVTVQPFVLLVHPSLPARSVKELIALAQARPGKLHYGSSGVAGASHLAGELFNLLAGVKIAHVPYKGGAESVVAAAAGQIEMSFASVTSALPLLNSGKLVALGVTTLQRTSMLPNVPSLHELGLTGYDHVVWYGMLAPRATPREVVTRLNAMVAKIVNTPDMKDVLNRQGLDPKTDTPQQLATLIRNEFAQNARLIKAADLKAD